MYARVVNAGIYGVVPKSEPYKRISPPCFTVSISGFLRYLACGDGATLSFVSNPALAFLSNGTLPRSLLFVVWSVPNRYPSVLGRARPRSGKLYPLVLGFDLPSVRNC